MKISILAISIGAILAAGCANRDEQNSAVLTANNSIDLSNFDTTVAPGDNFFQYVNGNWLKNNPIPGNESSWSSFNVIRDNNFAKLHVLLEEAAKGNSEPGSVKQKVGDFYSTAMDSVKSEKEGIAPLNDELKAIAGIKNMEDLARQVAHHHTIGVKSVFSFSVDADPKISTENIASINQDGLGLPDMDYYLNPDPSMEVIRKKYITYMTNMFKLAGETDEHAALIASKIFGLEKELAQKCMTRVQLRNIEAQYNKKTFKEFTEAFSNFDWNTYFRTIGVDSKIKNIIVSQPDFMAQVNKLVKSVSPDDWKNYLRWSLINASAAKLSDKFIAENFDFYGTTLNGIKSLKPRWRRVTQQSDGSLRDLVGQLYVEKYFSEDAKKKVNVMVDNLTAAYKERINTREWMGPETKKQALHKLETVMRKLAFPDKWRDYSSLEIKRDAYILNFFRTNTFEFNYMANKLGQPVDKTEWGMTPPTVNAYYNPSFNEIVFPAGIMQAPFFDANADDAVNYGAMGAVIGHELTHGFDDQGCQYDADGNLKNWWTKEDSLRFKQKTNMVIDAFNHFTVLDTFHINGQLTVGENIADLGGLTIAYYAYKKSLEGKPAPEKIGGLTGEQRFFVSWAQAWRGSMRPEALKQMLKTNPHSPAIARVIMPLSNMKEFYEAFNVKEGNTMYHPEKERAEIW